MLQLCQVCFVPLDTWYTNMYLLGHEMAAGKRHVKKHHWDTIWIALKESHKASVWIAVVGVVNLYLGFDVLSLKFTLVIFRDIFRVAEVWPLTWMLYYFNVKWV